jgi:uncharacterized protein (DUF1810 family)
MPDPLSRFVEAQAPVFESALRELRDGEKRTHWMWFVFPQLRRLGHSATAHRYGIADLDEARAYLAHLLLGARLAECTQAMLAHAGTPARAILGTPDDLKFVSCMTLFDAAGGSNELFERALQAFNGGNRDAATLRLLGRDAEA